MPTNNRSAYITATPLEQVAFDTFADGAKGIATQVFDVKPVPKADAKIFQFDASKLKPVDDEKGTNDEANLIDENGFYRTLTMKEFKLGRQINPRDRRDADGPAKGLYDVGRSVKNITLNLLMKLEKRASDLARTAANYPTALKTSLGAGDRVDDTGSIIDLQIDWNEALLNSCGHKANAIICDGRGLRRMQKNQELKERTKYTGAGLIPLAILKEFLEVEYIFAGDMRYDSAAKGAAKSIQNFWGNDLIAIYHNPSLALEDCSYGHMYVLDQPFTTSVEIDPKRKGKAGAMERVEVYAEYALGKGIVESESSDKFAAGYLVQNAFS